MEVRPTSQYLIPAHPLRRTGAPLFALTGTTAQVKAALDFASLGEHPAHGCGIAVALATVPAEVGTVTTNASFGAATGRWERGSVYPRSAVPRGHSPWFFKASLQGEAGSTYLSSGQTPVGHSRAPSPGGSWSCLLPKSCAGDTSRPSMLFDSFFSADLSSSHLERASGPPTAGF